MANKSKKHRQIVSQSHFSGLSMLAFLAVFGLVGGYYLFKSSAATLPNVWVSTAGNDSTCVRGDQTKPCLTLNKAYLVAQPGDSVQVACGNYPAQTINEDPAKAGSTSYVTFEPASTTGICWNQTDKITLGDFEGRGAPSYIELKDYSFNGGISNFYRGTSASIVDMAVLAYYPADHITIDNQNGGRFDISGVTNILIENSDLGNCESENYNGIDSFCVSRFLEVPVQTGLTNVYNTGSLINTKLHDVLGDHQNLNCGSTGCHTTGLAIDSANGLLIDRDTWWGNDTTNMRLQNVSGRPAGELRNITIQNSWFGPTTVDPNADRGPGLSINSEVEGLTLRFDSFSQVTDTTGAKHVSYIQCDAGSMDTNGTGTNCGTDTVHAKVYGNIMVNQSLGGNTSANCQGDTDRSYNIVLPFSTSTGNVTCDATEKLVSSFPYTSDPTGGEANFAITGATWAGDNDIPTSVAGGYPPTDYSGASRPLDAGLLDAGAVERATAAGTATPGDLNNDGKVDVVDLSILLSHYAQTATASQGDINGDGKCDILDLSILLSNYGK